MRIPQLVQSAGVSDKNLHFMAYLILVFVVWFSAYPDKKVQWNKAGVWWVLAVTVVYGAVDEWLQMYTGRGTDIRDFLANLSGVVGGSFLLTFFGFWRASFIVTGIVIFLLTNLARANIAELLPVTNSVFHVTAYAAFTALWLYQMDGFMRSRPSRLIWLSAALGLPAVFLLAVKLFSAATGRYSGPKDVILAGAAIIFVVVAKSLKTFLAAPSETAPSRSRL